MAADIDYKARGIGNLIGMPLAIGVGRRIVLLASTIVLVIGAILCATQENYEWHLWSRCAVGLAAGQSEALVPMITQEIFFLHERSKALMGQQAIQVSLTAVWVLFAGEIANAITPQWWYGLGAALAGAQLVLAFFFLPETKYERSIASFQEGDSDVDGDAKVSVEVVCTERPPLDFERYAARTWKSDLRLWVGKPDWVLVWDVLRVRNLNLTSNCHPWVAANRAVGHSKRLNCSFSPTSSGPYA